MEFKISPQSQYYHSSAGGTRQGGSCHGINGIFTGFGFGYFEIKAYGIQDTRTGNQETQFQGSNDGNENWPFTSLDNLSVYGSRLLHLLPWKISYYWNIRGGKQIIFPSDYVNSDVQEPNTYENWMHTDFINPIHPISHCDDGSNVIFDVYYTFKGWYISWVGVYFNDSKTTDCVCAKSE